MVQRNLIDYSRYLPNGGLNNDYTVRSLYKLLYEHTTSEESFLLNILLCSMTNVRQDFDRKFNNVGIIVQ